MSSQNWDESVPLASNHKAPSTGPLPSDVGFRPSNNGLVTVQPARLEDLQPSYAQVLKHPDGDANVHGWYASMSKSILPLNRQAALPS